MKNAITKREATTVAMYDQYLLLMEEMRLNYGRIKRGDSYWQFTDLKGPFRLKQGRREHPGPMPLDLKVYVIACQYDPDKRRFPEIIAELAKHKADIHPFARRFLIERMRAAENKHRELAQRSSPAGNRVTLRNDRSHSRWSHFGSSRSHFHLLVAACNRSYPFSTKR
jgi:hypothetical protein